MSRRSLIGVLFLVAACGDGASTPAASPVEAGATPLIESARPQWGPDDAWTVAPEPTYEIGTADGDPAYTFTEVVGFIGTTDGGAAVLDARSADLRYYDASGRHLRTVGGRGQGPGEFGFPEMLVTAGDSILVWDGALARVTVFGPSGDRVRDFGLGDLRARYGPVRPLGLLPDGSAAVLAQPGERSAVGGVERGWSTATLLHLPPGGGEPLVLASIPWTECPPPAADPDGSCSYLYLGFGGRGTVRLHADRFIYGRSDERDLLVMGIGGVVTRRIRASSAPTPVTDEMRRAYQTALPDYMRRSRSDGEWAFADSVPVFSQLEIDPDGNLWLREFRTDEWLPGVTRTGPREPVRWMVHDSEGRWLGDVTLPPSWWVAYVGRDHILTVTSDELDVVRLRRYEIRKP